MSSSSDRFAETADELTRLRARAPRGRKEPTTDNIRTALVQQLESRGDGAVTTIPFHLLDRSQNLRSEVRNNEACYAALKESIVECGLLQLPVVTLIDNRIVCVAGHRRIAALEDLGHTEVKCVVRKLKPLLETHTARLVENTNRLQLMPLELAQAIGSLLGAGYSIVRLSEIIGRDRKYVERLKKIDRWTDEAKTLIRTNQQKFTLKFLLFVASRKLTEEQILQALQEHIEGSRQNRAAWQQIRVRRQESRLKTYLSERGYGSREEKIIREFLETLGLPGWTSERVGATKDKQVAATKKSRQVGKQKNISP